MKKCVLCDYSRIVEKHHIIPKSEGGSDEEDNMIDVCPNHHKEAGNSKYKDEIRLAILNSTGKKGKLMTEKEREQERMIKDSFNRIFIQRLYQQ